MIKTALRFALVCTALAITHFAAAGAVANGSPLRLQGPCDIYAAAGTPCVAAHSTTRAMYASYNGPLYQVLRQSDSKTLDIGIVKPFSSSTEGVVGYADAATQDAFCAKSTCVVNVIYDQSGRGNHLYQAAPGTFKGPAKGGFDTQPFADMAPVTISGHKAYGVFIMPGMGFRNNNAVDIAVADEPEGIYYVVDGHHFDSGCCFDYGNSSTNGRAVGTGTMETTYFGTSTAWGRGIGPGPWIMSDMEAGLFSGHDAKQNVGDPTIDSWRFVTAVVDGGGGDRWDLRGGNAQEGGLTTFYSGPRPEAKRGGGYFPMHKKGAILLGTGGDNGNGSSGTFYEGAITTGYPTEATTNAVQKNIVDARYDVQRLSLSRATTFTPGSTQDVTVDFTNTTGAPVVGLQLSISLPNQKWSAALTGSAKKIRDFSEPIAPDQHSTATFKITSPIATGSGFLIGEAKWKNSANNGMGRETVAERVRNALPVKINEVRFGEGLNPVNQFIEIYNASENEVDLSNWSLISTQSQWAPVMLATIPSGTKLRGHGYYLLGLSSSGLVAPASPGTTEINVRSVTGFEAGQEINVDGETRKIVSVGTSATAKTTLFTPVSTGPWITIPVGSTNLPVTNATGFSVGEKIGIDLGGDYELATVTKVGKAATQTILSESVASGTANIKVAVDSDVSAGDTLIVGTGRQKEAVKVTAVGTAGATGTGVTLERPLQFGHSDGVDVSDVGTGISFSPATKFLHRSGDAVQALGSGIRLASPLNHDHDYGTPIVNPSAAMAGYQGPPQPNQWFGGTLSSSAGSIALMDAGGTTVDAMVYGSQQSNSSGNGTIASPELAILEGDQSMGGCIVSTSGLTSGVDMSAGRYPDGADSDSNCTDFQMQAAASLSAPAAAGANNIKVSSVAAFSTGQTILIDKGANVETALITAVGTAGATAVNKAVAAGSTVIPVASLVGFSEGQTISIGEGENSETVVAASVSRFPTPTINIAAPLTQPHAAGSQVSGTGITLSNALSRAHGRGTPITDNSPTPGAPNKYSRKSQ
jgi:hypothetical protein